jgi:uncharacterized protein YbaR (Trm112 family)
VHLALVDVLRCPGAHEPSALVATVDRAMGGEGSVGSFVERGTLACPICDARYAIEQGGVVFAPALREDCRSRRPAQPATEEEVLRAAALLGLVDPGGLVVLGGSAGAVAQALHERSDVSIVLLNPLSAMAGWNDVTPMYADAPPFAAGVLRGGILDTETADQANGLVAALRAGGRLIAPISVPVPSGMRELARDAEQWVAERVGDVDSAPISLRRADKPG